LRDDDRANRWADNRAVCRRLFVYLDDGDRVILLGMTMGNLAGGKIADKNPSNKTIGIILFGASLFTLMAITLVKIIAEMSSGSRMPYLAEVFMYTIFFFFPGMALSAVTPIIAKLTIANLKTTGRIVGKINATAALGSIAGTFATGFILISLFGTRSIIVGIAVILMLVAVGIWDGIQL